MAANIGVSIGIDGEKEFRTNLRQLKNETKTFESELKELESSFNSETSAMEKNRKKRELLSKGVKDQEKRVEELEKSLEASKKKYGENAEQTQKWKKEVADAKTKLNKFKAELDKIPTSLSQVGKKMQSVGKSMTKVGNSMSKYVTAPIVAVGAASIAAFREVDDGLDSIAKKTGATGEELEGLESAAKNIATTIPTSFEEAGNAVGTVSTKFGLTGAACEDLSTKFLKFAKVNDQDVSTAVEGTQKVMAAYGVETKDTGKLLDAMTKTSQKTGISVDSLQSSMVKNAAALKDMGLDAYQAANFLGQVESSGASTDVVMSGLTKALTNANKEGKTLPEALSEFQSVMNSTASDQEKLNAAIDLFGKKAGPAIYEACNTGSLSFESLSSSADEYLGSVEETFNNILDPADQFEVTMNELKLLGSEVGKSLLNAAAPGIKEVGDKLKDAADWFSKLDENQQAFAIKSAVVLAAGGPVLSGLGRLTTAVGKVAEKAGSLTGVSSYIAAGVTNPVGLAILAVGGLIGAFNLLDKSSGYLNEDVQKVVTGTSEAIGAMDSATASLSKTLADSEKELSEINGKADLAGELISELEGLENQTKLTAEQQGRMRTIVGQLNAMYPELGIEIDASTGKLNKSTKEIKAYVEQARKMKLIEAYQKAASKGYEDLAEAHIALDRAQKQQTANDEVINGLLEEQARLYSLVEDENGNLVDANGNFVMSASELDGALQAVAQDLMHAEENQKNLNSETEKAQQVYDDAEQTVADYEQAAENTAAELESLTSSTEDNTSAMDENTGAAEENASAVSGWAKALATGAGTVVSDIMSAVTAWDSLYQATKDSIEKQLGLFDEWEENHETTFADMEKNLDSQIEGMTNYADNMGKLSKAAVKSSDPNFKAFVKALNEMGIGAAGEVDTIVKMMENEPDRFNAYVAKFGENRQDAIDNVAYISSYIENDFTNGLGQGIATAKKSMESLFGKNYVQNAAQNFGGMIKAAMKDQNALADNAVKTAEKTDSTVKASGQNLVKTANASSTQAKNSIETQVGGADPKPEVKKVDVPQLVTQRAKDAITSGVSGVHGNVSKVDGGAAAGRAAKKDAEGQMNNMSGKVTSVSVSSNALSNLRTTISNFLQNNPLTAAIKAKLNPEKHAEGGFTYREQLSWLSEGNQPEVVIPLSAAKRDRALTLYEQTGQILGAATPYTATMSIPGGGASSGSVRVSFDAERMYAACAAGAKQGMENADIRIYIGDREAGRILRNMGVQFA